VEAALELLGLVMLGLGVGVIGTMVGVGGGFLLVPALLVLYSGEAPEVITSVSLAVVACSATAGTTAYARQKRIDWLAAGVFSLTAVPGAALGALVVGEIPRQGFDFLFGSLMAAVAAMLVLRTTPRPRVVQRRNRRLEVTRLLVDRDGDTYLYSYNLALGAAVSLAIGFMSSLLGIGGGVMLVPILIQVLRFPAHVATATSGAVLATSAITGTLVHIAAGSLGGGYERALALAAGVLGGRVPVDEGKRGHVGTAAGRRDGYVSGPSADRRRSWLTSPRARCHQGRQATFGRSCVGAARSVLTSTDSSSGHDAAGGVR
jgi:uncharacterized membrane protein YfcA